jgi:SNF2 family DNA or RNA helicase
LNKSRFQVLDSLLKLRQTCLIPELVNMENNTLQESIKLKYLEENIDDMIISGHNVLIFSQFTGFLKYIKNIFDTKNITYNYIDGQVKSLERKRLVDDFNNGETKVFLISLKAGGTGLNLTKADYVIHMDPWWNPSVENQATDRAHRM